MFARVVCACGVVADDGFLVGGGGVVECVGVESCASEVVCEGVEVIFRVVEDEIGFADGELDGL